MTNPSPLDFVTAREWEQLSLRVSELAARLDAVAGDRASNAVLAERVNQIRTDFVNHETGHTTMRRQLVAALGGLAVALLGIVGQYLMMLAHHK